MMGERVVVDPAAAARGGEPPKQAVPLDYGHADDPTAGAWRATAGAREQGGLAVRRLGGWRRVGFAFGSAFLASGVVHALASPLHAEPAGLLAWLGGLLLGFTVPIKRLDNPHPRSADERDAR